MLQHSTFGTHPYAANGRERREYIELGEMEFLDRKRTQFLAAVAENPDRFFQKVIDRLLGTTVLYRPHNPTRDAKSPRILTWSRWLHPMPFVGLVILLVTAPWQGLRWCQVCVMCIYVLYLL